MVLLLLNLLFYQHILHIRIIFCCLQYQNRKIAFLLQKILASIEQNFKTNLKTKTVVFNAKTDRNVEILFKINYHIY